MAHRPHKVHPRKTTGHRSSKQIVASHKWAAAGRAALKRSGKLHHRTARQIEASKLNLIKARAVAKTHHHHRGHASPHRKKATAPITFSYDIGLHYLPVCAPVALAEHLLWQTGCVVSDETILAVYNSVGDCSIGDLLEFVAVTGFGSHRLLSFDSIDEDQFIPGVVYGVNLPVGYHAVLASARGVVSWGMELPLIGTPVEAWQLYWD